MRKKIKLTQTQTQILNILKQQTEPILLNDLSKRLGKKNSQDKSLKYAIKRLKEWGMIKTFVHLSDARMKEVILC